jgi:regulator of protease activity HflC (stomatin/prohibitin superfamily)
MIAAQNEGQALLIRKTKEAEANGAFIKIAAENEAEAARLRGEGLAKFRQELTKGLAASADELISKGLDPTMLSLAMYTETIAQAAKDGTGNVIFFDGTPGGLEKTLHQLQAMTIATNQQPPAPAP